MSTKIMNTVIESISVTKEFTLQKIRAITLKELIFRKYHDNGSGKKLFRALDDVSFEIVKGSSVGIIGHNGAGKSTLLNLICGIGKPTSGQINVAGNIGALLTLATGFHIELSGRENIETGCYLNGIHKDLIPEYEEEIIRFSELEEFIDYPTRTYSNGMFLRLAFSTAIALDPEILVIDELLSVGDSNFQQKCVNKIQSLKKDSKTLVVTSHDNTQIETLCEKAIVLDHGKLIMFGDVKDALQCYQDIIRR